MEKARGIDGRGGAWRRQGEGMRGEGHGEGKGKKRKGKQWQGKIGGIGGLARITKSNERRV
jgi:hypothetical protein